MRKTNQAGVDLVKSFEGFRANAYRLEGEKYFTIGYGHSFDSSITAKTVWTKAQAEAVLKNDLARFEGYVEQYTKQYGFTLNDNQFAALVSYCYNRGPGGLKELLSHSKTISDLSKNIVVYWGSATRYKTGLINRREKEKALFMKKEEPEMLEKAIVINAFPDFAFAEPLAARLKAPIYTRAALPSGKIATQVFIVGGSKDGVLADNIVVLSGHDRYDVAAAVKKFLG